MPAVATSGLIEGARPRTYQAGVAGMTRGTAAMQGADDTHVIPATANAQAIGMVGESVANANDPLAISRFGEATAICGAPVVAGQLLIADANAHLVPSTAAGDKVIGYAVTSAAVAGDYFIVYVAPSVR